MAEPQPQPAPNTPATPGGDMAPPTHALARACEGCDAVPGQPCLPHCLPAEHPAPADDTPNTTITPTGIDIAAVLDDVMDNTVHGIKKCLLVFPLDLVLSAAEHANTATGHKLGYGEATPAPRLWWVKDQGTYLMSNGKTPADTRDESGRLPRVVYADGWGPGTDARSLLGGDDFRESLDLTTPLFEDGTTLLGMLREATATGATRFLLKAVFNDEYMDLTYSVE
ncbi:DUF3085 domain-containing protein [Streptomyces flaveolus]|uniref:DUF3085 domain-containing protein n=1 Tax=Streptomyces flaveolus TaxID=67297 RepID=UPI00331DE0A2